MAEKQNQPLNGAYYGPSVPPPRQAYHRPGRGRGCGCGCLGCLLKFIVSLVVIVGLAVLIFWLIFRPTHLKFYATEASLTQFNFTSNNTLQYNLALNITARNPNKKIGVYYDSIEVRAYYDDHRFDAKSLTPFYQGHKSTKVLNTEFSGQKSVLLAAEELSEFNSEKTAGVYNIDVKLYLQLRLKVGKLKTWKLKPKVDCELRVPLSSNGNSATGFESTKCDIDF